MSGVEYIAENGVPPGLVPVNDVTNFLPVRSMAATGFIAQGELVTAVATYNVVNGPISGSEVINGVRLVNWATVAVTLSFEIDGAAVTCTDYLPAAVGGVPGQWNCPFPLIQTLSSTGARSGFNQITLTPASGNLNVSVFVW